ncbi:UNVERIFIED_CONTAM: hypothetical protein FKN15_036297 [Acipenser sinensis]
MNTRCPPKRVPSAACFFTLCRLTVQPPQSYSVGGQRSSGQLTGKPAGARPDYRGRWCAIDSRKFSSATNETFCVFLVNWPYAISCSAVAFYIPLVLMVLAYQRIYITAMEHARQIGNLQRAGLACEALEGSDNHGPSRMKVETKAAKTLAIIMGCFCLCWAPFFITNIIDPFIDYSVPWQMWTAWLWLGYINSGLNPFLYAFLNRSFRRAFLRILCCGDERYVRAGSFKSSRTYTTSVNRSSISMR